MTIIKVIQYPHDSAYSLALRVRHEMRRSNVELTTLDAFTREMLDAVIANKSETDLHAIIRKYCDVIHHEEI